MGFILLVDDEPGVLSAFLSRLAPAEGAEVLIARTGAEGLRRAAESRPEVVLLDVCLPDLSGLEVFRSLRKLDARVPVVFVTHSSAAETAIAATKEGAFDFLFKPVDLDDLGKALRAALAVSRLARTPARLPDAEDAPDADVLVGRSPAMREVYQAIGRVAAQDVTVLITGESGTGKELVARAVYQHSKRADGPFLAVNCAAIPEALLESELFGHEKGAFTGADRRRIGKFEQCDGGTLFLDEVGDMPATLQAKLLRVLQDGTFGRVGGNETLRADVRVIAATHRDLSTLAAEGRFRADLYYRLGVVPIRLPALRDRGDDLALLVEHYRGRLNRSLGRDVRAIDPSAAALLRAYPWPGNIRELQSVLKQAFLRTTGHVLLPEFLPPPVRPAASGRAAGLDELEAFVRARLAAGSEDVWEEVARRVDAVILPLVLEHTGGSQQQAARRLGVARQTLRDRLRALGLLRVSGLARED